MERGNETLVHVGTIIKPHGIKGEVTVIPHCDAPGVFEPGQRVRLGEGEGAEDREIRSCRPHQDHLILLFAGVPDRNAAEGLRNVELFFEKSRLGEPDAGEFYHFEIIGARVVDAGGNPVGRVKAVLENPGADQLEIETAGGDFLLPFVDRFVREVRREAETVVVIDHFEGLRTLNR
ncbi:MAG: 16S rRNA processing protein RimM [Acidobacteria bacterium]|nr:16S rRNA processing protein RimM [Acidobacteriota bacterium]